MIKFLDLQKQYTSIKNEIDEAVKSVINESAFIGGKYVKIFEEEFAKYIGVKYCISVGNGTDALEIAIEGLDLPKGSEIIVPGNSFIASGEAATRAGNKIVFSDCHRENYTISIDDIKRKITSNTSAIVLVHLYGHPCNMDPILEIANKYGIKIIEDCAHAHGAEYKGQRVGTFGNAAIFSFFPGKNLGAYGDGGAILTNDENLAKRYRMTANHGRISKYEHELEGRNSRLDGIQAAILSVKLKYLDAWTDRRIENARNYYELLENCAGIVLPKCEEWAKHVYYVFVVRAQNRDELLHYLNCKGIETSIHYPVPLPKLKAYEYLHQNEEDMFINTISGEILSLPVGEHLVKRDIEQIASCITGFYN